jgi:hypothetical protein
MRKLFLAAVVVLAAGCGPDNSTPFRDYACAPGVVVPAWAPCSAGSVDGGWKELPPLILPDAGHPVLLERLP